MFEQLHTLPDDPVLGLMATFAKDSNPNKVDLGVGVYKNNQGQVSIVKSVLDAEREYLDEQTTKAYKGIVGDVEFNQQIEKLIYGEQHSILSSGRVRTVQTPGSTGGLYLSANLIKQSNPEATLWVSTPTWANHFTIFEGAGVNIKEYPYYQTGEEAALFDAMLKYLDKNAREGDVILLHGCCHNPTGADLSDEQWQQLTTFIVNKKLVPLVDQAYQGYSRSFEEDAYGIACLAEQVDEMLVSYSCSKSFTIYCERTGALSVISKNSEQADASLSQLKQFARACYSMPPNWGATLVKRVLQSEHLTQQWQQELSEMRGRVINMRVQLADKLIALGVSFDPAYLKKQNGMFSFLPLSPEQVDQLRIQKGVYMARSGRISFTGLTSDNIDYVSKAIAEVSKG